MRLRALVLVSAVLASSAPALAQGPGTRGPEEKRRDGSVASDRERWRFRYEEAREDLVEGRFREAEIALRALALEAGSETDRRLALELAALALRYADLAESGAARPRTRPSPRRPIRTADELTLLYGTSFLYGIGTGAWFLLQVQPDSALSATIPFAALAAAPAITIATLDGYRKLPRGLPHALSAGMYLGLAESAWIVGYQHGRGERTRRVDPDTEVRWTPASSATVLWLGATTGGILGATLGGTVVTTPGRVSFVASTAMWSGAVLGLGAAAVHPDDDHRRERAFLAAGAGLNAGLISGFLLASEVSPSVARVRLVDLLGFAGAAVGAGLYLSVASPVDARVAEGLAAAGATVGLATGWLVTAGMPKDTPGARATSGPTVSPNAGGGMVGFGGAF